MTYTLWKLIRDVYQHLGRSEVSAATGGTTTTLADSTLAGKGRDDDYNDGVVLILSAGGAAPEGEIKCISDYEGSTGTFTFESAMTAAPESGDLYLRVDPYFSCRNIVEQVNKGLVTLGEIPLVDTTSLDTAEDQTEYTAAVAWKRRPPIRVDIQTRTGDADVHRWREVPFWEYVPAAAGETGLIVFDKQLAAGRDLRVWYLNDHPRVSAYNDVINELINPALATAAVAVEALRWRNARLSGGDEALVFQLKEAKALLKRMRVLYPIWRPRRQAKMRLAGVG